MLIRNRGVDPKIDSSAYVAPTAVLVGRVEVGPRTRIMYGAVLDSEASKVEIGECAIVCENAVLRATSYAEGVDLSVVVGDHAFVGPHATLLGCVVEPACYVATGATVLQGATVESGAVVAVGALVHANTKVPGEFFVPPNTIAVGDPLRVYAPGDEGLPEAIRSANFARTAFGVQTAWEDRIQRYRETAEVKSDEFGSHAEDVVLDPGR
jgi:carbonic anhydrase/acetyltransferase-like protein (isoleucine patch superfamily)